MHNIHSILWRNEQKAIAHAQTKVALEWDCLEEATQGHEEVLKPPLVKLASKILLKILGISNWGVGYIPRNAFSQIEKSDELGNTILQCKLSYARKAKLAWNATLWEQESNKSIRLEEM
jgi:hypothetical protein